MSYSPIISELIESLCCLPGIGRKSAQRIAFHLLERDKEGAQKLSQKLASAVKDIRHCERCRMFTDEDLCLICRSSARNDGTLCVVESPADVMAIEEATGFKGKYFILMGHLSPIDGIGPEDLGIDDLINITNNDEVKEVRQI